MPSIVGNLGGFSLYAWVPAVYLLTSAVSTPIYGKVADLVGRKPVLFFGIGLFLLGSVTSGAAPNMVSLIIFRALQGLGAGAVFPITTTIIGDIFTLQQRARMQGVFGSVWGISSIIGPLLGGFLVDNVGWRWIFYLNLPVGALAVIMIWSFFNEDGVHREHRLDIFGATALTVLLTSVLLVLIEGGQAWPWISAQSAGLVLLAVVSLVVYVRQEERADEPALPLDLFRNRIIAVSALGTFFAGAVMVAVTFEVPLYAQGVLGQDALHAGLALAPMSLGWPIASSFSGRLAIRLGYRITAVFGLLWVVVGTALLLTLTTSSPLLLASAYSFVIGVGMGLSSTPMLIAVQSAVPWVRRGVATGATMFVRSFGGVVGLAIMGAIVNNRGQQGQSSAATNQALDVSSRSGLAPAVLAHIHQNLYHGIHQAYLAVVAAAVLGLVAATFLPSGSATEHEYREPEDKPGLAGAAGAEEQERVG
jgi:EmrB/QacA subfamily drug resistance transporter